LAIGHNHIGRDEIVNGEAVLAGEPPKAAADGKSGDTRI
jgi:hypothetical protein